MCVCVRARFVEAALTPHQSVSYVGIGSSIHHQCNRTNTCTCAQKIRVCECAFAPHHPPCISYPSYVDVISLFADAVPSIWVLLGGRADSCGKINGALWTGVVCVSLRARARYLSFNMHMHQVYSVARSLFTVYHYKHKNNLI